MEERINYTMSCEIKTENGKRLLNVDGKLKENEKNN